MIVQGVRVMCCLCPNDAKREASCFVRCGGGGLYYCDRHAPKEAQR